MGKRNKVTTRDIAEQLGISQSTVSMILSNKPNVSFTEETVQNVRETAKKMGYKKPVPKETSKEKVLANTIIVLCPLAANGYYSMMIHSITEQARVYGYTVMSVSTFRDAAIEETYLDLLAKSQLAGIISLYPPSKIQKINTLSKQIPIVSVGDKPASCHFDSVELDSKKPGYMIGEYLISLGHAHITYISSPIRAKEIGRIHRLEGVRNSFREAGIPEEQLDVRYQNQPTFDRYSKENAEYSNGYDLASQALEEHTPSTAFIGNNDITAFGIMAAIYDHGFRIPADYSVCGFDNISFASMPQISLTTIDHASILKGREAVDIIHKKNQQKRNPNERSYIMRLEYEPQLIVRKSTGKCPKARQ
ncbi:MAG: LacI family transcriptional regulator [Clostridiales bacterium]|nr:LacI family transcriptional regulator [Clostridiales bacterium]